MGDGIIMFCNKDISTYILQSRIIKDNQRVSDQCGRNNSQTNNEGSWCPRTALEAIVRPKFAQNFHFGSSPQESPRTFRAYRNFTLSQRWSEMNFWQKDPEGM